MVCSVTNLVAQEQVDSETDNPYYGLHEAKLNALVLVLGAVEVQYEYLLNEESGLGISVFLPYDKEVKEDLEYYVSPYFRYYFGSKYAGGFFLEGFASLNRADRDFDFIFIDEEENFVTDLALGIGLGGKWITKGGFVGEVNFGLGRNLFNSDETDLDFIGKFGISIGYRF